MLAPRPGLRPRYRSLGEALRGDVGRAIAMASGGALVFVPVECLFTIRAYTAGPLFLVEFGALVLTLTLWLWFALAAGLTVLLGGTRLVRWAISPARGTERGLFDFRDVDGDGVRPGVPRLWGAIMSALVLGALLQRAAAWAIASFKEPQLTAALIAVIALGAIAVSGPVVRAFTMAARAGAAATSWTGPWNPLGRWRAAGASCALVVIAALELAWRFVPQSRSVLPIRMTYSLLALGLGAGLGLRYLAPLLARRVRRTHGIAAAIAGLALVINVRTLVWRSDEFTAMKYAASTSSPAFDRIVQLVRWANDVDRDGYGSLLGEVDCAPFDGAIHPGAKDLPDDGVDQDCNGSDFTLADLIPPPGPTLPVPEKFKRDDWNFLFLTIDTVRYDRTTFGGYAQAPKGRDTTPRLAELVARSSSFTFCQAPSAGTMASIPAILTSKFFHSGIALDENRPAGTPPKITEENTILPEIMKRKGYRTGVIGSHEWWTDWGLDQGVDKGDYDNSIGEKPDAFRVAADKVTDHALGWIARQQGKKWFLWAHYIDPHGRYVAHPNVVSWGNSEPDLYETELRWTDQEVGRLLDELTRLPSYSKTIVVITSDHGDSMGEHNIPVGTHGSALYKEMLHVPLIIFIPDNKPRLLGGAVTNLDIVPTIAELAGIDVSDLSFEGKSLVPQLFYGREDKDRAVFAETNAPGKQRAAITEKWKLIYYLSSNLYELYDLAADPTEKTNLAAQSPPAMAKMKAELDRWMNRVLYARDPVFNQAARQMGDVRAWRGTPPPAVASQGHALEGKIDVVGMGPAANAKLAPGGKGDVHVYFKVREPIATRYKLQLVVWPLADGASLTDPLPSQAARSALRATADGVFPTDKWPKDDTVRERFPVAIPPDWRQARLGVGLVAVDPTNARVQTTGPAPAGDNTVMVLGELPLGSPPAQRP